MTVALIAAVAQNGVIGAGNAIPWRLPSDFAHFKRTTMGKPLVMGRRTFESIGRPLPGRTNIVVSRRADYHPEGVVVFDSLDAALAFARAVASGDGVEEVMVGGGGEIYRAAMPVADRLYISHVDLEPEGDAYFPAIDMDGWELVDTPHVQRDPRDTATYRVNVYARRRPAVR